MISKVRFVQIVALVWCFSSCNGQAGKQHTCSQKFKIARELAYGSPDRQSALDSALALTNEIVQCDSIRKAVVDFKITLLIALKKYQPALNFIDSLNKGDFLYDYKKATTYNGILALKYDSEGDKVRRDSLYKATTIEIEKYVESNQLGSKEFKAAYTELFAVKGLYATPNQIDNDVELLKKKYPDKETFFDFFKSKKNE